MPDVSGHGLSGRRPLTAGGPPWKINLLFLRDDELNSQPLMNSRNRMTILYQASGYLLSILLVPLYVSLFTIWKHLSVLLGSGVMTVLPPLLTLGLLFLAAAVFRDRLRSRSLRRLPAAAGVLLCLAALLIPDGQFPVKRIHVAEYLLLSLVVRFAMSFRLQGLPLLFFTIIFSSLLGIHDEFLQGLHPARTYGLRDMAVNIAASIGGALLWHGLDLFSRPESGAAGQDLPASPALCYLAWLLSSVFALAWPLQYYRDVNLPLWPAMPLAAALVFCGFYAPRFPHRWRHGIIAASILSFSLFPYLLLTHAAKISFH
jgi:hypothetical protein